MLLGKEPGSGHASFYLKLVEDIKFCFVLYPTFLQIFVHLQNLSIMIIILMVIFNSMDLKDFDLIEKAEQEGAYISENI